MGELNRDSGEIHAKIVYWGASGSGRTANLQLIHRKLKKDHRGELTVHKTQSTPVASYDFLPVELGTVRGLKTSIHLHTTPGDDAHEDERLGILDGVDGVVLVADLRPERHEATLASLEELTASLASYDRTLEDVVFVVQYNHRDEADENALDELHRKLGAHAASQIETIASEGTGVLQCLTAISKLILARIRERPEEEMVAAKAEKKPVRAAPKPTAPAEIEVEVAVEDEGGFKLVTAGSVKLSNNEICIPIRLIEESSGREIDLSLRLSLGS